MDSCGLGAALSLADSGALVLWMCDQDASVREILATADGIDGVRRVILANGREEIRMSGGGKVVVKRPDSALHGYVFDAIFAPPSVWSKRRCDLILSTARSHFFADCKPVGFSTFERIL